MKYFFIFFLIISALSCTDSSQQSEDVAKTKKEKINSLLNAPSVKMENPTSKIVGEWDCLTLGETLSANRHSLPSKFLFRDNSSYDYTVIIGSTRFESNGTYFINKETNPIEFTLKQVYPRTRIYNGIIEFVSEKVFRTIFYAQDFSPAPVSFQKLNTQIFEKQ